MRVYLSINWHFSSIHLFWWLWGWSDFLAFFCSSMKHICIFWESSFLKTLVMYIHCNKGEFLRKFYFSDCWQFWTLHSSFYFQGTDITVNSEDFARVLFSQNFADARSFAKKTLTKCQSIVSFTAHAPFAYFTVANMYFNVLAKQCSR